MFIPDREDIVRVMKKKGYAFFEKGCNNLNIIGIRNDQLITNAFDDTLCCIRMGYEVLAYNDRPGALLR